ncbi:MAG: serine/threonine protein kinase, partial [bacterium]|nr:serine/threonine protein kinase [bacterium]
MTPDETLEQTDSTWGEQVKVLCRSFREQWQSGDSPSVKDWLTKVAGSQRESLFRELLAADIECRLAQGEPIESSIYLSEFPQYCDTIQEVFSEANPTSVASNFHADGTELVTSTSDKSPSHQVGESTPSPPGYEILNEIARGGMGVVYKAQQHRPQRVVALKMVLAGRQADAAERKRFFAEAEAAAKLNHPGIVPIIEVGEHQGLPFFSMRFVGGKDLRTETSEQLPAPRAAAQWLVQVSQAVAYAHNQGVIHRDLKPANILLDEKGQPLITDFGLAKRIDVESDLTL